MSQSLKKLIVILLAIWLPLFAGNALAASMAMSIGGEACHGASMLHLTQQTDDVQQVTENHDQHAANQPDAPCKAGSLCHLACCAYLVTASAVLLQRVAAPQHFTLALLQFQSVSLTILDPPPLARV